MNALCFFSAHLLTPEAVYALLPPETVSKIEVINDVEGILESDLLNIITAVEYKHAVATEVETGVGHLSSEVVLIPVTCVSASAGDNAASKGGPLLRSTRGWYSLLV